MKNTVAFLMGVLVALCSCRNSGNNINATQVDTSVTHVAKTDKVSTEPQLTHQDFLASLEDICVEDEGIFKNCDELFSKDGASLFFLIIPKTGAKNWHQAEIRNLTGPVYEKNNALSAKIKAISKDEMSRNFDVWVFYTDKMYTEHVGMDAAFNVKNPHITDLYFLKSGRKNWQKLESFKVNTADDVEKEIRWRDDFISRESQLSNQKSDVQVIDVKPIPAMWSGSYSAYFNYGEIAGQNAGWALEINIKDGKATASGNGYQMAFADELSAEENSDGLTLKHLKNISGYKTGSRMNPEFILTKHNGKFYVKTDWIGYDITNPSTTNGYEIEKRK